MLFGKCSLPDPGEWAQSPSVCMKLPHSNGQPAIGYL